MAATTSSERETCDRSRQSAGRSCDYQSEGGKNLLRSRETNVHEAPPTLRPKFNISSFLLLIALIAFCLGVARAQLVLGIALAVVLLPATAYTTIVAFRSASTGRPMSLFEKLWCFGGAITGVMAVEFAALVAFCITCIPTGFVAMSAGESAIIVAVVVGGIAAVAAAVGMTYYLLNRKWRLTRNAGKP